MIIQLSSKANSDEVNGVGQRAVTIINNSGIQDVVVGGLNKLLNEACKDLTKALNKKSGSDFTPLVQQLETLRDKGLKAFFKTVYAACFRLNEEIEEAAQKLKKVIKRHGSTMYNLPQDVQTSKAASLFEELKQEDLVAAIELTNTTQILEEAIQSNQYYLDELAKRSKESTLTEEQSLVGENVKKVRVNLEKTLNYLDSIITVKDDDVLTKLFNELEGVIEKANTTIKSRSSRKNNKKEE